MRVEYINPFVEAAFDVMQEVLTSNIDRGELYLKKTSQPVMGVAAIVGLVGDVEGRVLFDMSQKTALEVASEMNGEKILVMDELAAATITELANLITARAVTKLQELGFSFDLTPPTMIVGENMQITTVNVEALVVPIKLATGKVEINVAMRERL